MKAVGFDEVLKGLEHICVVSVSEAVDLRTAYKKLEENGRPVFIAALPEELSLGGMGLSLSGEIKKEYTAFRRWYDAHRAEGGAICVDVRKFNAGQLAQLNDLFDRSEERRVGKECRSRWSP